MLYRVWKGLCVFTRTQRSRYAGWKNILDPMLRCLLGFDVVEGCEIICRKHWLLKVMLERSWKYQHETFHVVHICWQSSPKLVFFFLSRFFWSHFANRGLLWFTLGCGVQMPVGPWLDLKLDLGCKQNMLLTISLVCPAMCVVRQCPDVFTHLWGLECFALALFYVIKLCPWYDSSPDPSIYFFHSSC